jgi:hypothetical protein
MQLFVVIGPIKMPIDNQAHLTAAIAAHTHKAASSKGKAIGPISLFAACLRPATVLPGDSAPHNLPGGGEDQGSSSAIADASLLMGFAGGGGGGGGPGPTGGRGDLGPPALARGLPPGVVGTFTIDVLLAFGTLPTGTKGLQSLQHLKIRLDGNGEAISKDITVDDLEKIMKPRLRQANFKRDKSTLLSVFGGEVSVVFDDQDLQWTKTDSGWEMRVVVGCRGQAAKGGGGGGGGAARKAKTSDWTARGRGAAAVLPADSEESSSEEDVEVPVDARGARIAERMLIEELVRARHKELGCESTEMQVTYHTTQIMKDSAVVKSSLKEKHVTFWPGSWPNGKNPQRPSAVPLSPGGAVPDMGSFVAMWGMLQAAQAAQQGQQVPHQQHQQAQHQSPPLQSPAPAPTAVQASPRTRLRSLRSCLAEELMTQEEFDEKRKEILANA